MAYVQNLFNNSFLEYASYVIKDRAIPDIEDGLKPVQRRILHSMYEVDDGKFHKVANITGHCAKYHPHGDQSIFSALVVLANKDLFIDKQGNFGNIYTGDDAAAARYIECRLSPMGRDVLFNSKITEYVDSYDARNKEPLKLPAKIPVLLAMGAEGIAVGMATKILPHNFAEILEAEIAYLNGEQLLLYPDFPTAGMMDVSEYNDGNGKVRVRAKLDISDEKKIVITEIPYGTTTESVIASVEEAARSGKIKIASINDYTAEKVEIEILLPRGIHTNDVVDGLYAFTECESSISVNFLVIKNERPEIMSASAAVTFCADRLVEILKAELKLEDKELRDRLHAKTLEQIFIENRIYKKIEDKTSADGVIQAVIKGLDPFADQIKREVTTEDVESLLKIPIRRISMYDINRAKKEMDEIKNRLSEIKTALANITGYAISFLENLKEKYGPQFPRLTEIISFQKVDVREAAQRNLKLRYDKDTGYLGYEVNGNVLFDVSPYDRLLVIRKSGVYSVIDSPDKLFVDKGMFYCELMDKDKAPEIVFNVLYKENESGYPYLKRCTIEQFILNKGYSIVPDNCTPLKLTTDSESVVTLEYKPKPRLKVLEETFMFKDYLVKGVKAGGVRLANKEVKNARLSPG